MNYQYTINELSTICQVSKQSIYQRFSKNQPFINQNSTRQGRKIFYNQSVLEMLQTYYGTVEEQSASTDSPKTHEKPLQAPVEEKSDKETIAALEAKIDALEAQIEELKAKLEATEAERKDLVQQNGCVLLMLAKEKEEKLKLMPPERTPIGNRIMGFFKRKGL